MSGLGRWAVFITIVWSGVVSAKEIVPPYVPLSSLDAFDVTVEFNADVHLRPDRRTWYFQNGKWISEFAKLNLADSHCYLGTKVDLFEPKIYKKGEAYSGLELVTQTHNTTYLVNPGHELFSSRSKREDLYVIGCEARGEMKTSLKVGDLYRHLGWNVILRSDKAAKDLNLIEQAGLAQAVTRPVTAYPPFLRKLVLNKAVDFQARPYRGFDRSRYFFQHGRLLVDNVNFKDLNRSQPYCVVRFNDDLESGVIHGAEFVPARAYKSRHGFVLESDQYRVNPSAVRSVRCERYDGREVSNEDIVEAFGANVITLQI